MQNRPADAARQFRPISVPSRPTIVAAGALFLVAALAYAAAGALVVFVLALIIAVVLDPLVTRISAHGPRRSLVAAGVVITVTLLAAISGLVVGVKVAGQAGDFLRALPRWVREALAWYATAPLPSELRSVTDALIANAARSVSNADLVGTLIDAMTNGLGVVLWVFGLLPFFLFFVLSDRPRTVQRVVSSIPAEWRGDAVAIAEIALRSLAAYVRSEAVLMVLLAGLTWLGVQGVALLVDPRISSFALFLTLIAAFSELIPLLGPWIAAAPAMLFAVTLSPETALAVAVVYLVIAIIEGQVLVPLVEGRHFSLHPAAVGIALVVGGAVAGLLGTILALPVLASGIEIFRYVFRRSTGEIRPPNSDSWTGVGSADHSRQSGVARTTRRALALSDGGLIEANPKRQ
jgi:predicted PurR-regulated permease PerM